MSSKIKRWECCHSFSLFADFILDLLELLANFVLCSNQVYDYKDCKLLYKLKKQSAVL